MAWKKVPPELIELLEKALASFNCDRKMMFGSPTYMVNNNMFTGAHQDSLFIRLSEQDRQEILSKYDGAGPFEPMAGRPMKEYIALPEELYRNPGAFQEWLQRSHRYTASLPPKERKRRTPKRKQA